MAEDEAAAAYITTKNGLKSYTYNLCSSLANKKLADKFDTADKTMFEGAINDTTKWLDASQEGLKEEYEEKQNLKELSKAIVKYISFS